MEQKEQQLIPVANVSLVDTTVEDQVLERIKNDAESGRMSRNLDAIVGARDRMINSFQRAIFYVLGVDHNNLEQYTPEEFEVFVKIMRERSLKQHKRQLKWRIMLSVFFTLIYPSIIAVSVHWSQDSFATLAAALSVVLSLCLNVPSWCIRQEDHQRPSNFLYDFKYLARLTSEQRATQHLIERFSMKKLKNK